MTTSIVFIAACIIAATMFVVVIGLVASAYMSYTPLETVDGDTRITTADDTARNAPIF